ncbi:uncharacterized protein LOC134819353 isoform X1 [Bolinopsis microptera]|uniref:uncharacterized protein LOC134819353 isoform X1 n=1 Tax=Bolinopsis microptera TaxID=2820187 RepID=UPI003078C21B
MSPKVFVPMNFGIQLLDSPTHSTLELKASQGAVIPASSVILSFNSPVIDHMTTTLHLTSIDMKEFSEAAVRYFVHAAYTGETPPISRDMFRDINKLANVFKMSWLVNRCVDQFENMTEAIQEASYEDLIFLFDEAVYVLSNLKSRQLVEIALKKIQSLNGESQRDFISRYLQNLTSLCCQQLDLIIELTKTNVEYVVKPITEQITASSSNQGTLDLTNFKYTLENIDLSYCLKNNIQLYERLFGKLEELCGTNDDLKWLLRLQRKSFKESLISKESVTSIATTSASGVAQLSDSNIIPNMLHTLNTSLTFDEVVDWLGTSDEVVNLWMFFEGIWTWMNANEGSPVKCSSNFLNKVREIRKKRKWREVSQSFLNCNLLLHKSESSREFFQAIMSCEDLCIGLREAGWNIIFTKGLIKDIFSLFEQETKLYFICEGHASVYNLSNCSKPGKCGFILKTVPAKEHANFVLSTDPNDYSEEIHYHNEIHAKDMHLEMEWFKELEQPSGSRGYYLPMSWAGRPVYQNNEIIWDTFPVTDYGKNDSYCFCLFFPTLPSHQLNPWDRLI